MVLAWKAVYNDDSELDQFDGETENKFGDINMGELKRLEVSDGSNTFIADLGASTIKAGETTEYSGCSGDLVYFRRNRVIMSQFAVKGKPYTVIHLGIGSEKLLIEPDGTYSKEG